MSRFTIHTKESAPADSKPILESVEKNLGFVPNMIAELAESPLAVKSYTTLQGLLGEMGSFSPAEMQIIWLAISKENGCHYCVAAHSTGAAKNGVDDATIEALRNGDPLEDERLEALRRFIETMVEKRGWAEDEEVDAFLEAGFTKAQVLEVVTFMAHKTISNYVNHLADTPVDEAFEPRAWKKAS